MQVKKCGPPSEQPMRPTSVFAPPGRYRSPPLSPGSIARHQVAALAARLPSLAIHRHRYFQKCPFHRQKLANYCQKLTDFCPKLREFCPKSTALGKLLRDYFPKLHEFCPKSAALEKILHDFFPKLADFPLFCLLHLLNLPYLLHLPLYLARAYIVRNHPDHPTPSTPPTPNLGVGGVEGVGQEVCIATIRTRA